MGLMSTLLQPVYAGVGSILMPPSAFLQRPARWLSAITKYRATTSGGPNFAYDLCLRRIGEEERAAFELSSWRMAFSGAEPVRAETIERFSRSFEGCGFRRASFYPCYGLAEATLFVTGGSTDDEPISVAFDREALARRARRLRPRTISRTPQRSLAAVVPGWASTRISSIRRPSQPAAAGAVGEIWLAGESMTSGYWNRSQDDSHVVIDAPGGKRMRYLRTGDLGFFYDGAALYRRAG